MQILNNDKANLTQKSFSSSHYSKLSLHKPEWANIIDYFTLGISWVDIILHWHITRNIKHLKVSYVGNILKMNVVQPLGFLLSSAWLCIIYEAFIWKEGTHFNICSWVWDQY